MRADCWLVDRFSIYHSKNWPADKKEGYQHTKKKKSEPQNTVFTSDGEVAMMGELEMCEEITLYFWCYFPFYLLRVSSTLSVKPQAVWWCDATRQGGVGPKQIGRSFYTLPELLLTVLVRPVYLTSTVGLQVFFP